MAFADFLFVCPILTHTEFLSGDTDPCALVSCCALALGSETRDRAKDFLTQPPRTNLKPEQHYYRMFFLIILTIFIRGKAVLLYGPSMTEMCCSA